MRKLKLYQSILAVAIGTLSLLMIPWIAMFFTDSVQWSVIDFVIMGILLFSTGLAYVLVTRQSTNIMYRCAMALGIGTTLFLIWANLAVGLIGGGPNPGNFMYIGVLAIAIIGSIRANFESARMERAMYNTAVSLIFVTVIALFSGMQNYPGSSVMEIIGVNLFFAFPYTICGVLFGQIAKKKTVTAGK